VYLVCDKEVIRRVLDLYKQETYQFSFIGCVLTKIQKGKIYVNNKSNPTCAFIIHKFGWAQIIGKEDPNFLKLLIIKIKNKEFKQKIRFYNCNLKFLNSTKVIKGKRVQYSFNKLSKYKLLKNKFEIKKISSKNFFPISKQCKLDLNKRFWNSKKHFLKSSFGYSIQKDSKFIATCYSCASYGTQREIDIVTLEKFRKLGLAKVLACQFIFECKKKGLEPRWDCYKDNFASNKLALSLGFKNNIKSYNFIIINA
jgi:hypothetical protein